MSLLPKLLEVIEIQHTGNDTFIGKNLNIGSHRVYGGQVLAQALKAANKTEEQERQLHSIHGYFLSPGDNDLPIEYQVERTKDGRSFSSRRVIAKQKDRVIFISSVSYHIPEESVEHQSSMPNVAQPESLTSFSEIFSQVADKFSIKPKGIFSEESPIIFHPVEHYDPFNPGIRPPKNHVWFKVNGQISTNKRLRQELLAYASDFNLLITAMLPHNMSLFTTPMQLASLDHAMWFHRDIENDDWMLYVVDSSNLSNARGFCTGKIYSRSGRLLASVAQEGLIRLIK